MVRAKPPVKEDVVYVHVAVEGRNEGKLVREEFVRSYFPTEDKNQDMEGSILDYRPVSLRGH